uniref:Uncharacterized protein n=1 Tax=Streptomyces phage Scarif TaxID=3158858 RepID=A0AAU7GXC0_9CAUD
MAPGDNRDIREQTRVMKELVRSNDRLIKVCEALNDNLVIFARLYQSNHGTPEERTDEGSGNG